MNCPNCGAANPPEAKFCESCGQPVAAPAAPPSGVPPAERPGVFAAAPPAPADGGAPPPPLPGAGFATPPPGEPAGSTPPAPPPNFAAPPPVAGQGMAPPPPLGAVAPPPPSPATRQPQMPRAPRRSGGQPKGFFGSLFDLSFENFVATKLVKVLFVLGIVAAAIYAIGIVVMLLSAGISASAIRGGPGGVVIVGAVIGALILAPLVFFLMVLGSRIWCEVLIVMFRIAEHTGEIAEQGRNRS